ncbi:variable surface protein Vir32/4, putative [Plasmodium vivax]|uniref:Variable surface protein Vir32/4, putative n=1 Tax=Plasmodium vivax (strain Salvador I) TaxID=126793 RepID=A5KCX6_PLAVS|nr:variable surface protein Vir32/4, putative [Plasmodium vivax]EDL42791.1 variable surface protein Vir32/4, putative [Plasmodium vivax]|eukprot:XP_001612582.1 variable surface protein Vir32/4 [Plasmodium vivax Sal-1]
MAESLLSGKFSQYFIERELWLPSDKFYQKLDYSVENVRKYNDVCTSLNSIKKKIALRRPCALVLNYLANTYKKLENENSAYDECILLNYWIYGKIYEQYKDLKKSAISFGELQSVWNDLIKNSSKTAYYDKCQPDFHMVMKDDWRKRKELYDYFVDYNTLKGIVPNYDTHCKEIYTYLKDKDVLYKEYSKHCSKTDNSMCPDFFAKNNEKDPNALLKKLSCYEEMRSMEALKLEQRQASAETDPGLTVVAASLPLNSQKARDGTNPVTNSGNVLLGVVVTSMTSGALYKFTPLGRMLRNGLGWNRNNINLHDNGLFEYAPGSFNPYSMGGDEHYIGYQPA